MERAIRRAVSPVTSPHAATTASRNELEPVSVPAVRTWTVLSANSAKLEKAAARAHADRQPGTSLANRTPAQTLSNLRAWIQVRLNRGLFHPEVLAAMRRKKGGDMFFTHVGRELRRRRRQAVVVALGIALVVTVSAMSEGVSAAQESVLHSLYGVGTDITVTQAAAAGTGGPARFGLNPADRASRARRSLAIRSSRARDPPRCRRIGSRSSPTCRA